MNSKINILWVESRSYLPEYFLPKHFHNFFHYIYVVGGSGEIKIDDKVYKLVANHIYLVSPGVEHSFWADKATKLVTKEIKFEASDDIYNDLLSNFPASINCINTPVYDIFNRIHNERITKKSMYKELSHCLLSEIFLYLKRNLLNEAKENDDDAQDNSQYADDISKVKVYIKNNIDNDITLQELADVINLEKTYFVKKFKNTTGVTPMQYVRDAKLTKAKKLLLYSDMNITQISQMLSFSSIHRFSEFFLKETGVSPQKFKKNNGEI